MDFDNNKIVIFRNQLFKVSESFICNQAERISRYSAIYVGRNCHGNPSCNADVVTMESCNWLQNIFYILFRISPYLAEKIKKYSPRLIHAHFGVDAIYAQPISVKLSIPLVVTFHGFDATNKVLALLFSGKPAWINYLLYRRSLKKTGSLFICVSDFIRKKVVELGFPEDKVITHYIGIDTNREVVIPANGQEKIILHVARLTEKKGTRYLIEAFSKISRIDVDVKLVIIGDGPLRNSLELLVKDYGLDERVLFQGAQSNKEVFGWMSRSVMVCVPSVTAKNGDSEGLPIVCLEASLVGLPVIGTYHAGIPEVICDGVSGWLVPERDSNALADRIAKLLSDNELCRKMGLSGRKIIMNEFDITKQSIKLEALYDSVLGRIS